MVRFNENWSIMKAKDYETSMENWIQKNTGKRRILSIMAMTAVAMQASGNGTHDNEVTFDTNSAPVGVDNRCIGCIPH
jgi:hypothetical protein